MSDTPQTPAAWHPDPFGRHQMRYWDGAKWTEHVSNQGKQSVDPPTGAAAPVLGQQSAEKVQAQVAKAGVAPVSGGGTDLLDQPILVVNQKWKIIEINNEYAIFDQAGTQIGAVRQVGQSKAKKVLRFVSNLDQYMTHTLQVVDAAGAVRLVLTRPAKIMKSTVVVQDGQGAELGRVVQENMIGKIHFRIEAGGQKVGSINAENWRAWNFSIRDAGENEVARVTKTWEGLAKTMFTTADHYVVQIHSPLVEPMRSMVVAASLAIDTALKQDSRGLG